jgi:hypothetical protein
MSQKQSTLLDSLKQQHQLLWPLLGFASSLWLVSQLGQERMTSILLFVGLLATHCAAGQWAARLIARSILRWGTTQLSWALIASSLKIGAGFSLLSVLLHLVLLGITGESGSLGLLSHATASILLRAAILPVLACLGAACRVSSTISMQSPGMLQYPANPGLTTLPD